MSFKEHDNNQYTKENTDVEKYLLRIIQRYFDIENNYTKESIEAIILESLTRFKQMVISEKGFIFSLNKKTGNIVLSIRDLNGESNFNKNTAFNKDFGNNADTICEGNDERLYNDREPLQHVHDILSIKELQEALQDVQVLQDIHFHNNQSLLDMLTYTGTKTEIDLIVFDQLERTVENYCNTLNNYSANIKMFQSNSIDAILTNKALVLTELSHAKELVYQARTWIDDIRKHIDKELQNVRTNFEKGIPKYVTKEALEELMSFAKQSYFVSKSEEVPIPKGVITCIPHAVGSMPNGLPYGTSFIQEESKLTINVSNVNNIRPKLYFRYEDENNNTHTLPLPFCVEKERSRRVLLIEGTYDKDNIYITSRFINKLDYYADASNFYDDDTMFIASRNAFHMYDILASEAKNSDCEIALIDSSAKNTFVKNLLLSGTEYYIQGYNFKPDGSDYVDDNENVLTYTDWDAGEPNPDGLLNHIKYGTNKKWAVADGATELIECVVEYKIKPLSTVYKNARIYYQAFGNKEGL